MNDKERAAMQQALGALGRIHFAATELDRRNRVRWFDDAVNEAKEAITALREALTEQAKQEPVAFATRLTDWRSVAFSNEPFEGAIPLYTAPVRTKNLTDDEIEQLVEEKLDTWSSKNMMTDFARAVIAADREKNK